MSVSVSVSVSGGALCKVGHDYMGHDIYGTRHIWDIYVSLCEVGLGGVHIRRYTTCVRLGWVVFIHT